jgi:hypothetical protein
MVVGLVIRRRELNTGVAAAYSVLAVALLSCLGPLTAVAWSGSGRHRQHATAAGIIEP